MAPERVLLTPIHTKQKKKKTKYMIRESLWSFLVCGCRSQQYWVGIHKNDWTRRGSHLQDVQTCWRQVENFGSQNSSLLLTIFSIVSVVGFGFYFYTMQTDYTPALSTSDKVLHVSPIMLVDFPPPNISSQLVPLSYRGDWGPYRACGGLVGTMILDSFEVRSPRGPRPSDYNKERRWGVRED